MTDHLWICTVVATQPFALGMRQQVRQWWVVSPEGACALAKLMTLARDTWPDGWHFETHVGLVPDDIVRTVATSLLMESLSELGGDKRSG